MIPSLPLGEPPADDPRAAAELWLRYVDLGEPSQSTSSMFFRMVNDPNAVLAEVAKLRARQ